MFKRRCFPVDIILVCIRWYYKYGISYRDLAEMMQERGVDVDPSTIMRWVYRYAPELEKRGSLVPGIRCDLVASGRDVCEGRWPLEVPVPSRRQAWPVDRLHVDGSAKHPCDPSFPGKSADDNAPLAAVLNHHGPTRLLSKSH
jgi:hypothetical protein